MLTQFSTIFTDKTISKLYLSPYVKIYYSDSGVFINHTIKSQKYLIPGDRKILKELFETLHSGVDYQTLLSKAGQIVNKEDAENWIAEFMQRGVLE
ncbi:hypothetical protein BMS3Abin03_00888 [bacterium BMS3Abin03]|nr:hypothetical protein BMS3Abin03_00888 [bacterium BMS3Abin03]